MLNRGVLRAVLGLGVVAALFTGWSTPRRQQATSTATPVVISRTVFGHVDNPDLLPTKDLDLTVSFPGGEKQEHFPAPKVEWVSSTNYRLQLSAFFAAPPRAVQVTAWRQGVLLGSSPVQSWSDTLPNLLLRAAPAPIAADVARSQRLQEARKRPAFKSSLFQLSQEKGK